MNVYGEADDDENEDSEESPEHEHEQEPPAGGTQMASEACHSAGELHCHGNRALQGKATEY